MKKIGIGLDQVELDATHIIEDSECCLVVPAVIAREGVFCYPEGKAYKPADELRKAAWTADNAWIVADAHPDTLILMDPEQISGRIERSRYADNAIKANLRFLKSKNRPQFLADIKSGKLKEVSIGFFYEFDATPGEFNGKPYDFVQRNILIDHVAAGVTSARCAPPACGIAIDSLIRKVAADPWEETDEYIRSGHKEPSDTCRTIDISEEEGIKAIYCKYGDDWDIQSYLFNKAKGWTLDKAKTWFEEHKEAADAEIKRKIERDQEEGELERKREAARERCGKYPVSLKEGGNLTKPSEYENIPEDSFADPCNFRYPIDEEHVMAAWAYINKDENRVKGGYSEEEWTWMKNRVKKRMEAKGHEVEEDALREIERAKRLLQS